MEINLLLIEVVEIARDWSLPHVEFSVQTSCTRFFWFVSVINIYVSMGYVNCPLIGNGLTPTKPQTDRSLRS